MPDWKKMKAEYVRGGVSYRKLAEKYGVSFSTLRKVASRENWTDLRNITRAKQDMKMSETIAAQEAKRVERFKRISDKLLTRIEEGIEDYTLIPTARALHDLTDALKTLREINDIKCDRDIREQEARIEKLRKDAAVEEQNSDIRVVIAADLDEYAK